MARFAAEAQEGSSTEGTVSQDVGAKGTSLGSMDVGATGDERG